MAYSEVELPGDGTFVLGPQCEGEIACSPSNPYVDTNCGWACFRDTLWSLTVQPFADCMRSKPKMSREEIKAGLGEWNACDQAALETVTASLFGGKGGFGGAARDDVAQVIIESGKFDYLFGRVSSSAHNAARSTQNLAQMTRLGINDSAVGRSILREHLEAAARSRTNILRTYSDQYGDFVIRESLLAGPSGNFALLESTWQVMDDGAQRLTTVIPKGG